jgi:pimeloyl-ACP methyl ester carboxylesterase
MRINLKFLKLFLVLIVGVFFLVGSGGGSSSSSVKDTRVVTPISTKAIFSGTLPSYIIKDDINITIQSMNGEQLALEKVKEDGSFLIEIENFKKQNVMVNVTSGYEHLLLEDDPRNEISVTVLTSLVSRLIDKNKIDLKSERERVVNRLDEIALLNTETWRDVNPVTLNGEYFETLSKSEKLSSILEKIIIDLDDNELNAENMGYFPMIHGGVLSLKAGDNNGISKILGDTKTLVSVDIEVNQEREKYLLELIDGEGMTVEGNTTAWFLRVDTTSIEGDKVQPYKLRLYNKESNKGRFFEGKINVLEGKILAEGTIEKKGGRVLTSDKKYGIEIPAGQLSETVTVKIISAKDSTGEEIVSFKFDKKLPKGIKIKWISPLEKEKVKSKDEKSSKFFSINSNLSKEIDSGYGYVSNGARLFSDIDGYVKVNCSENLDDGDACSITFSKRKQWKLMARTDSNEASWRGIQPVVFVHGYTLGDNSFGGGDGTWGHFFELLEKTDDIEDIDTNRIKFVPFEFQWKTNTKFQLAGEDLAKAIQTIYRKTGKKVLIIAHSFGGVLTRTMIQNPQTSSINNLISGVVSLGSPYSGISASKDIIEKYNMQIPQGYDFDVAGIGGSKGCMQISCYQMGDDMKNYEKNEFGRIISLIQNETHWSTKIPLTVGIGLKFR